MEGEGDRAKENMKGKWGRRRERKGVRKRGGKWNGEGNENGKEESD